MHKLNIKGQTNLSEGKKTEQYLDRNMLKDADWYHH